MAAVQALIEMFATEEAVQALEARYRAAPEPGLALELAWALRQRDTARALQLLRSVPPSPRLWLTEAECVLLLGRLDEAAGLLQRAEQGFAAVDDAVGLADVQWLHYYLAADRGDTPGLHRALERAIALAERGGDARRRLVFEASLARAEVLRDRAAAESRWADSLPAADEADALCAAALNDFRGMLAALGGQFLESIECCSAAYSQALHSGQLRRAIALATNLGFTFTRMHDYESAIDWLRRALELARSARWPGMISLCLAHTGEALRRLGQLGEARELLQECLQLQAARPQARTTALGRQYLADVSMDLGDAQAALQGFEQLGREAQIGGWIDLQIESARGCARALPALDRAEEAVQAVQQALALCQSQHERGQLPELRGQLGELLLRLGRAEAARQCYAQALEDAQALPGYRLPPALLDGAARAHAAQGQYEAAFELSRRAGELREQGFSEDARQRSRAMHTHHQIERARAESEHLRRLAASEAARFETLKDAHAVLQHLSSVGQEITAELQVERVLEVLERRVHALLHASCMMVYLLDESGSRLLCEFGVEDGEPFHDPPIPLDAPDSYVARCARERREFVLDAPDELALAAQVADTPQPQSLVFMPLMVAQRLVGVLSLQSPRSAAYGEREQLILRSLAAYAAIALENAHAYQRLSALQRQLLAQEKLAALGALVAGVAHEINTPIGNSLLATGTLLGATRQLAQRVEDGAALRRSDWQSYARDSLSGLEMIERNMHSAASLVDNLKQVVQERDVQQRRQFALAELAGERLQPLAAQAARAGHALRLEIDAQLRLDSYPGPLGQALEILVGNALLHGLEPGRPGVVTVLAAPLDEGRCRLEVRDNGRGMSEAVLERVFDPFFSTRFGQGGNGLGLAICHTIVCHVLGGEIHAHSAPGRGSRFIMSLPLRTP